MSQKFNALRLNIHDNIVVALQTIEIGEEVHFKDNDIIILASNQIPYGHKIALCDIPCGGKIIKYGECMGISTQDILKSQHVHVHNVRGLNEEERSNIITEFLHV